MGELGQPSLREVLVPGLRRASGCIVSVSDPDDYPRGSKQTGANGIPIAPAQGQEGSGSDAGESVLVARPNCEARLLSEQAQHLPNIVAVFQRH